MRWYAYLVVCIHASRAVDGKTFSERESPQGGNITGFGVSSTWLVASTPKRAREIQPFRLAVNVRPFWVLKAPPSTRMFAFPSPDPSSDVGGRSSPDGRRSTIEVTRVPLRF